MYGGSGAGPGHRGLAQAIDWAAAAADDICHFHRASLRIFTAAHFARMHHVECTLSAQNWLALTVPGASRGAAAEHIVARP